MNRYRLATLATTLLLALSATQALAAARMDEVASFNEMKTEVERIKEPGATLVVMDDDDTLSMMSCPDPTLPDTCQYLGGPAWFAWQQAQLDALAQPRVADSFDELLSISSMLFAVNNMPFTAEDVGPVLNDLARSGVRLLVETARGNGDVNATLRQFGALNIQPKRAPGEALSPQPIAPTLAALIAGHSLEFNGAASLASPYLPCDEASTRAYRMRPISYQQGAMFLSGQNKGIVLKCMLDAYNRQGGAKPITQVFFIDDTRQNVIDVYEAFKGTNEYRVKALHYTRLEGHKKALTEGPMAETYQENAMGRWYQLRNALEGALMNPVGR